MNPNAGSPNPTDILPLQLVASMVRRGADPNQMFQQNPLSQNMTPGAMGADPTTMPQPPMGSQAQSPMPQSSMQPSMQQSTGQVQPMDESTMILQALQDRLSHHSKVTEKTISTLTKMIEAGIPVQPNPPTA